MSRFISIPLDYKENGGYLHVHHRLVFRHCLHEIEQGATRLQKMMRMHQVIQGPPAELTLSSGDVGRLLQARDNSSVAGEGSPLEPPSENQRSLTLRPAPERPGGNFRRAFGRAKNGNTNVPLSSKEKERLSRVLRQSRIFEGSITKQREAVQHQPTKMTERESLLERISLLERQLAEKTERESLLERQLTEEKEEGSVVKGLMVEFSDALAADKAEIASLKKKQSTV